MRRVPERETAKAAGERFYFTGKPCKNGHLSKRYTGTGVCAKCATTNTLRVQAKKREHPNRTAARGRGEIHYSTGVACRNGHDRRWVSNAVCTECGPSRVAAYLKARPGLEASWARKRRAVDPVPHRKSSAKWYETNRLRAKAAFTRWRKANPQRVRELGIVAENNRRARKKANGGSFNLKDIANILERQNGHCAGCGQAPDKLEIDHIMPIKLGGSSDPHNLQLLCFPCNRSKGAKHPDEWFASLNLQATHY
jgi:5-methylcytosine-specific restriction endonuclease McrA